MSIRWEVIDVDKKAQKGKDVDGGTSLVGETSSQDHQ